MLPRDDVIAITDDMETPEHRTLERERLEELQASLNGLRRDEPEATVIPSNSLSSLGDLSLSTKQF